MNHGQGALDFPFLRELKRRNVVRVGLLYLAVCWLILEPVHVIFHMLEVPVWANRLVLILMALGFPAVMIFAWVYEITPEGLKPTDEVPHGQSIRKLTGRRLDFAIIATLSLALVYLVADKFWLSKHTVTPVEGSVSVSPKLPASISSGVQFIPEKSVAVLPFLDLSERKDQEYFSDGLSEELIDMLTKIADLRVPARSSSFYFKGKNEKLGTIAKELRVAHLLEGSVRKADNRLRVSTHLIRADDGYDVWSQTYDRNTNDIFKVQDEIATAVVNALSVSLLKQSVPHRARTSNAVAYTLYLQGRARITNGNSLTGDQEAIAMLEQASKLDPGFAPTWATLARVRLAMYVDYHVGSRAQVREDVLDDAGRAIALDPGLSEGHLMKGRVLSALDWNWAEAEAEIDQALGLDPTNADVLRNAAYLSIMQGRFDEAVRRVKAAAELDPLSFYNYMRLGNAQFYAGSAEQAEASYRTALALKSDVDELHADLALVLAAQGKREEALIENELEPESMNKALVRPIVLHALGRATQAERSLLEAETRYGREYSTYLGVIFASRGDLTRAFEYWDRAFRAHDPDLAYYAKAAPIEAQRPELATDPRYKALLRKMNLPE
jgi:adenylate cyclase